jgi:hypothetical protein
MDIREFWNLIEQTKAATNGNPDWHAGLLTERLAALPVEEIMDYSRIHDVLMRRAYRRELWDAAVIIEGGVGTDGFVDFRSGLIAQGETIYENALRDPDTLADVVEAGEYIRNQTMGDVDSDAYREKTGEDYPLRELMTLLLMSQETLQDPDYVQLTYIYDMQFMVSKEKYESEIKQRFPRLYEKFYPYWKTYHSGTVFKWSD